MKIVGLLIAIGQASQIPSGKTISLQFEKKWGVLRN
jgi:hypothetical protein